MLSGLSFFDLASHNVSQLSHTAYIRSAVLTFFDHCSAWREAQEKRISAQETKAAEQQAEALAKV